MTDKNDIQKLVSNIQEAWNNISIGKVSWTNIEEKSETCMNIITDSVQMG